MVRKVVCPLHQVRVKSASHMKNKWFNEPLKKLRTEGRKLTRKWRKTKSQLDHQKYLSHAKRYKMAMKLSKKSYVQSQINRAANTTKALFAISKSLTTSTNTEDFTPSNPAEYCEKVATFFTQKVALLREKVDQNTQGPEVNNARILLSSKQPEEKLSSRIALSEKDSQGDRSPGHSSPALFTSFTPINQEEAERLLKKLGSAYSELDPFPTSVIQTLGEEVLPDIVHLVNSSLKSGMVPDAWKCGLVTPLLKKPGADQDDPKNLRPVSQLRLLARISEAAITSRLQSHVENNHMLHDLQSGFRPGRGTELAVADIRENVLWQVDRSHPILLVLLDLSAAFDTVDHSILIQRLREIGGVEGVALEWFRSFLTGRTQAIRWGEARSSFSAVPFGVPQGSSLSPLLFNIYLRPLATLLEDVGLRFQMYADDVQLLVDLHEDAREVEKLVPALVLIEEWMRVNKLCLNGAKTELLLFEGRKDEIIPTIPWPSSWGITPTPARCTRDLGMILSHTLDGAAHVAATAKTCHHHLNALSSLCPLLTIRQKKQLYQATVGARLNYGLFLLLGAKKKTLAKLQKVQNRAIRMIFGLRRRDHLSQWRIRLKWLTIQDQLKLKVCAWLWKATRRTGPHYTHRWAPHPQNSRKRRTQQEGLLALPKVKKIRKGGATLAFKGTSIWNSLPAKLRTWKNPATFKTALKDHFLEQEKNRLLLQDPGMIKFFSDTPSSSNTRVAEKAASLEPAVSSSTPAVTQSSNSPRQTQLASVEAQPSISPRLQTQPGLTRIRGIRSPSPVRRNIDRITYLAGVNKAKNIDKNGIYRPRKI